MDPQNIVSAVNHQELLRKIMPYVATGFGIYCADRLINSCGDSCGDAEVGEEEQFYSTLKTIAPILSLPIQLRCKIWAFLSTEELRILRLVCGRFQCDVDMMVGVHVILDSRSPCYQWVKHIAVQSCSVKALESPPDWSIFAKPNLLNRMEISKDFRVDADILKSIMTVFDYLEEFSFHMQPEGEEGDGFPVNELGRFLTSLENHRLDGLTIEKILESWTLKWTASFRQNKTLTAKNADTAFSTQLSHIFLGLPLISGEHQKFWITILKYQKSLKTLNVNLGDTHWLHYKDIVETNSKSLRKVFLSQVRCTTMDDGKRNEDPFDFAIFQHCKHLQVLGVSCESIFSATHFSGHYLPTSIVNLEKVPHEELEGLLFAFLNLTERDLKLINSVEWGLSIKRGILLNCAVDKSCIPTLTLKKHQIDTSSSGYYPLLGESLEGHDPSCYHEPDIIACCTAIKTGFNTLLETSNVLEEWATPIAVFFWAAFC